MGIRMLRRRIASIVDWVDGFMGVAVQDVSTGEEVGVAMDEFFPMASVCKTPILVEAYRRVESGTLSLKKRYGITKASRTAGSGLLNYFEEGCGPV